MLITHFCQGPDLGDDSGNAALVNTCLKRSLQKEQWLLGAAEGLDLADQVGIADA